MKCIALSGVCPVLGCDEDGECYIERCERPYMPKPVSEDAPLAHFAELVLAVNAAREIA